MNPNFMKQVDENKMLFSTKRPDENNAEERQSTGMEYANEYDTYLKDLCRHFILF